MGEWKSWAEKNRVGKFVSEQILGERLSQHPANQTGPIADCEVRSIQWTMQQADSITVYQWVSIDMNGSVWCLKELRKQV